MCVNLILEEEEEKFFAWNWSAFLVCEKIYIYKELEKWYDTEKMWATHFRNTRDVKQKQFKSAGTLMQPHNLPKNIYKCSNPAFQI